MVGVGVADCSVCGLRHITDNATAFLLGVRTVKVGVEVLGAVKPDVGVLDSHNAVAPTGNSGSPTLHDNAVMECGFQERLILLFYEKRHWKWEESEF